MPNEVAIRCADRAPYGELPPARQGAQEQEVTDVHARDEQQESDGGSQHGEHRPRVADDLLGEGTNLSAQQRRRRAPRALDASHELKELRAGAA